jgi:hypothetical protein
MAAVALLLLLLLLAAVGMSRVKGPARAILQARVMVVVRARATRMTAEAADVVGGVVDVAGVGGVRVGQEDPGGLEALTVGQRMPVFLVNRGNPAVTRRRIGAMREVTGATEVRDLNRLNFARRVGLRSGNRILRPGIGNPAVRRIGVRMNLRHPPVPPDRTVPLS